MSALEQRVTPWAPVVAKKTNQIILVNTACENKPIKTTGYDTKPHIFKKEFKCYMHAAKLSAHVFDSNRSPRSHFVCP